MSNAVEKIEHTTPVPITSEAGAIIAMIERAATNPAVDIDKMERLFKMHGDVIARNAKTAYAAALSAMQPELPVIERRGTIGLSKSGNNPMYARWEDINDAIRPVLAKHGFAITFRVGQAESRINVTGVLSHREGHTEETTMSLPIDAGAGRNAVQAVGSSTSYGKRYTAAALLNLTSRGEDDDAKAAVGGFITEEQVGELVALIEDIGGAKHAALKTGFLKYMRAETLADIPAKRFRDAVVALENKRAK